MIDDYDSSEGRWPGLGAFLVGGRPGLGRRRETGIRGEHLAYGWKTFGSCAHKVLRAGCM